VADGDYIEAGTPITVGPVDPNDLLRIKGREFVQEFLLDQIQQVYRMSGVSINDKHIEVIVRQMLRRVRIEDPGDTPFIQGDIVDQAEVREKNQEVVRKRGKPARFRPVLLGLTRASLTTDSFIAAASFQETTKVLSQAAIAGKVDPLKGLKENVIIGSLIPAGTGFPKFRTMEVEAPIEEVVKEEPVQVTPLSEDEKEVA
ncbi:MAG: DNA-directed RNA polymerase subunit beta', partial [Candidatus Hydrothermae bacterium]|nr:DNA-directed RNA polymerase subunit beta' [Candidatus Hydrothermae bacterium]